jgi:WD40 repeat protein
MPLKTTMRQITLGPNRSPAVLLLFFLMGYLPPRLSLPTVSRPLPTEILSIDSKDLSGEYVGSGIADFAISPDNTKIAVGFELSEGNGKLGAWLGEWEIASRRLIAKAHLPNPVSGTLSFVALDHQTVQFTPDGSKIIFQADLNLYAFDSETLNLRFSASVPELMKNSASEEHSRKFAISSDGTTLAIFYGQSLYPRRTCLVRLVGAKTGDELAHWPVPVQIQSLSLSPDGKQLLVSTLNPPDKTDLLMLDSLTGRIIKSFESGFGTQLMVGAELNALFVDADHFIASLSRTTDAKGNYLGRSLKIFDCTTGKVTSELASEKFGPSGELWVSSKDSAVATLNLWSPHWKRRFSESGPKSAQILFFHLNENHPFCALGPLPERSKESARQSGFVRFSTDLGSFGLFMNKKIFVYATSDCHGHSAAK